MINHKVPHELIYFMLPWHLSSSFFPQTQVFHFALWNLEDLCFSCSQDSCHWPVDQTISSSELHPQNKYTTSQTKGALFKSQSLLEASCSHTIIHRANYKSFALDSAHYFRSVKLAITMILVKWSTARNGLCSRCKTFHRDNFVELYLLLFKIQRLPSRKLKALYFFLCADAFFCFFFLSLVIFFFACLLVLVWVCFGVGLFFFLCGLLHFLWAKKCIRITANTTTPDSI